MVPQRRVPNIVDLVTMHSGQHYFKVKFNLGVLMKCYCGFEAGRQNGECIFYAICVNKVYFMNKYSRT